MKFVVLDMPVEPFESTWEGVTRQRVKQWAQYSIGPLITSFQLTLDVGKHLPPGEYTLAPESFAVNNGRLTMPRAVLVPLVASAKPVQPGAKAA